MRLVSPEQHIKGPVTLVSPVQAGQREAPSRILPRDSVSALVLQ